MLASGSKAKCRPRVGMKNGHVGRVKEITMSHYFIGIDLGGTVTKAGIYTSEGKEVTVAARTLPVLSPQPGFC